MRVAILSEDKPGFIKPMSLGLAKMLASLEVKAQIFPEGLAMLNYNRTSSLKTGVKNLVKKSVNLVKPQHYLLQPNVSDVEVTAFEAQLHAFDFVVVVCHVPDAFVANQLSRIESLRVTYKKPIMLYQNYYLATRGDWYHRICDRKNYGGGFGLQRYDWYLAASIVSEYPLTGKDHPCSVIGHDLRDDSLIADADKPFKVLLDFERKGFEQYRQLQIQALQESGIEYTQLTGRYTQAQIRALYREHSALFLSFRESFGLPIVENQLCGNFIFAPYKKWTPSHFIDKSPQSSGEGRLGENFRVYNNDLETLKSQLVQCRDNYQPRQQLEQFKRDYPQLYHGDLAVLQDLLGKVSSGDIRGDSHQQYQRLNSLIAR